MPERSGWRSRWLLFLLSVGAIMTLQLCTLLRFPPLFVDEPWFASRAWGYLQTGRVFGPVDRGVIELFDGYWTLFPWLPTAISAAALWASGEPALLPIRLVSLGFGAVLLAAVYLIGRRAAGHALGATACLLTASSFTFTYLSHLGRIDIVAAAIGYSAIALSVWGRESRFLPQLVAGMLIGLSFECHPHSVGFGVAAVLHQIWRWRFEALRRRELWGLVLGGSSGILFYAWLHILPYPESYFGFNRVIFGSTHTPPLLLGDPAIILESFEHSLSQVLQVYLPVSPIILLAAGYLIRRPEEGGRILVALFVSIFLAQALLVRNHFFNYFIFLSPSCDLLLAWALLAMWNISGPPERRRWIRCGVVVMAMFHLGFDLRRPIKSMLEGPGPGDNSVAVSALFRRHVKPEDSVLASPLHWFDLRQDRYTGWINLVYYRRYRPGASLEEAMRYFAPDIFILDDELGRYVNDLDPSEPCHEGIFCTYRREVNVPKRELEEVLRKYGELLENYHDGDFKKGFAGNIKVYRMHWGRRAP